MDINIKEKIKVSEQSCILTEHTSVGNFTELLGTMELTELKSLRVTEIEPVPVDIGKLQRVGNTKTKDELIKQLQIKRSVDARLAANLLNQILVPVISSEVQSIVVPENLLTTTSTEVIDPNIGKMIVGIKWEEGEILWAKVSGHPWWPGVVGKDLITNTFVKSLKRRNTIHQMHIYFFGVENERGWVNESSTMLFKGRADFDSFCEQNLVGISKRNTEARQMYVVAAKRRKAWEVAVAQAELALPLSKQERLDKYKYKSETNALSFCLVSNVQKLSQPSSHELKKNVRKEISYAHKKFKLDDNLSPVQPSLNTNNGVQRSGRTVKQINKIVSLMESTMQKKFTSSKKTSTIEPSLSNPPASALLTTNLLTSNTSTPQKQKNSSSNHMSSSASNMNSSIISIDHYFKQSNSPYIYPVQQDCSNICTQGEPDDTVISHNFEQDLSALSECLNAYECLNAPSGIKAEINDNSITIRPINFEMATVSGKDRICSASNESCMPLADATVENREANERKQIYERRKTWLKNKALKLMQDKEVIKSLNLANKNIVKFNDTDKSIDSVASFNATTCIPFTEIVNESSIKFSSGSKTSLIPVITSSTCFEIVRDNGSSIKTTSVDSTNILPSDSSNCLDAIADNLSNNIVLPPPKANPGKYTLPVHNDIFKKLQSKIKNNLKDKYTLPEHDDGGRRLESTLDESNSMILGFIETDENFKLEPISPADSLDQLQIVNRIINKNRQSSHTDTATLYTYSHTNSELNNDSKDQSELINSNELDNFINEIEPIIFTDSSFDNSATILSESQIIKRRGRKKKKVPTATLR